MKSYVIKNIIGCALFVYLTIWFCFGGGFENMRRRKIERRLNRRFSKYRLHAMKAEEEKSQEQRKSPPPTTPVYDDRKQLDELLAKRPPGYPWPCGENTPNELKRGWESFKIGRLRGLIIGSKEVERVVSDLESFPQNRPLEWIYADEAIDILYCVWKKKEASLFVNHTETEETKKRRVMLRRFFEPMEERLTKDWPN